jgi:diguanylate cyclase (GGDEF)-like protein
MITGRLILVVALITAAAVLLYLSFISWRRRKLAGRAAVYLSICGAAVSIYCFGYALEVSSNSLPDMMFWVRFQYWGIFLSAPAWLLFSLCLAGEEKLITRKRIVVLFIVPVLYFMAAQTLGWLNLAHHNPHLDTSGAFPTFAYDRGLINTIGMAFMSLCLGTSTLLFTVMLLRSAPAFRTQAVIFWIGSMIPWCSALLYSSGVYPNHLDFTPLALSLCGLIYVLTFFKFRMLDIVPLAHDVIFDGMQDGVLVLDTSDRVIDLNPRLHAMLPSVSKTAVGASAYEVLAPYPALLELLKGSSTEAEVVMMSGLEAPRYYRGTLIPLLDRRKRSVGKILTLYDDTQVKQLLDQLERLATHDGLTGVCNRRYFNELAGKEIYRAQRYGKAISFIMLDVDHFKLINDTYGHAAGDAALKALAETIQGMLRQSDIIGRYGGEEFVILLPEIDPLTAVGIAEKLRSALEQMHIQYEEHALDLRASFGVTGVMPPEQVALNALQRYADRALYEAKETGRNRVCVSIP